MQGGFFPSIRRVYSHHMALKQCERFFERYRKTIEPIPAYDTAGSVKTVVEQGLTDTAAIASKSAAKIYGGNILWENMGDDPENYTRFFLLGQRFKKPRTRGTKTSIAFTVTDEPGAIVKCLICLSVMGVNLTKIESRQNSCTGHPWQYLFYVDFIGNLREPLVAAAFTRLKDVACSVRVFGCYPVLPPLEE